MTLMETDFTATATTMAVDAAGSATPFPRVSRMSDDAQIMRARKARHLIYACLISLSMWVLIICAIWFGFIR